MPTWVRPVVAGSTVVIAIVLSGLWYLIGGWHRDALLVLLLLELPLLLAPARRTRSRRRFA